MMSAGRISAPPRGIDASVDVDVDAERPNSGVQPANGVVMEAGRQRRPSVFDLVKSRIGTSDEAKGFFPYLRAAAALYGSILFWVGAWSMIDHQLNDVEFLLPQHLKDIGIGMALLIVTDTYYQVGFVYGSFFPSFMAWLVPEASGGELPTWAKRVSFCIVQFRVIVGITGSVFMWNGLYNSLYYLPSEDWIMGQLGDSNLHRTRFLKNTSAVLVGLLVVFLSDTLLAASGVPHVIAEDDLTPAWGGPVKVHLRGFVKSTVSTVGQAFTWFGIYELTMTWCPDMVPGPTPEDPQCDPGPSQNAWKPVAMLFIGLSLFFATDAFISSAYLDENEDGPQTLTARGKRRRRTVALYARAIAAIIGAMVHNTGLWVLLDEVFMSQRWGDCSYLGEFNFDVPCGVRNLCFTIVGYLVMLISNSAAGNAGVDKSYDLTPTPVMHYRSERTNQAVSTIVENNAADRQAKAERESLAPSKTGAGLAAPLLGSGGSE